MGRILIFVGALLGFTGSQPAPSGRMRPVAVSTMRA
jgi:hypothetical protein